MNILKTELRANLKSLFIWSGSMVFLIYAGMLKYSGFSRAGAGVNELFEQFPPAMRSIFGLSGLDISSIAGFYAVFYLYFMLLAGVHAVMLGAVIISKEERDKTADFLFSKPVTRSQIITSKFFALLINIVIFNLVTLLASILFVEMFNAGESITDKILQLMLSLFMIQLIFASLGAAIAAVSSNIKQATSLSAAILLTAFFLSVAIDLYSRIEFLKYFTPFKYFPAADLIQTGHYSPSFILLSLLFITLFTGVTYRWMASRDIQV